MTTDAGTRVLRELVAQWRKISHGDAVIEDCAYQLESAIPVIEAEIADLKRQVAEQRQQGREEGWQEAAKLVETGTKAYVGKYPDAFRTALNAYVQERVAEAEKSALLRVIEKLNHVGDSCVKSGHTMRGQMFAALCKEISAWIPEQQVKGMPHEP